MGIGLKKKRELADTWKRERANTTDEAKDLRGRLVESLKAAGVSLEVTELSDETLDGAPHGFLMTFGDAITGFMVPLDDETRDDLEKCDGWVLDSLFEVDDEEKCPALARVLLRTGRLDAGSEYDADDFDGPGMPTQEEASELELAWNPHLVLNMYDKEPVPDASRFNCRIEMVCVVTKHGA